MRIHQLTKVVLCLAVFEISVIPLNARISNVETGNQQWLQYYSEVKIAPKWSILSDAGYRWRNLSNRNSQCIIRTGGTYYLNSNIAVALGIALSETFSNTELNKIEFRPYQEFTHKYILENISIKQRIRLEERYFKTIENEKLIHDYSSNFRFRYSIIMTFPLAILSSSDNKKKILFNVGNEIFINTKSRTQNNIFDQNRILIGPTFQFNKNIAISLIYNNQFNKSITTDAFKMDNIIWLQVKQSFIIEKS